MTIDWPKLKPLGLGSRVSQRFALMGVVFILLPLALFSFYISSRVATELDDLATIQLQKNAKAVGMDIIQQLRHADELLHLFASKAPLFKRGNRSSYYVSLSSMPGLENFESLTFVNGDNSFDVIKGDDSSIPAILAKLTHKLVSDDERSVIITGNFNGDASQVFLMLPVVSDRGQQARWLVASLSNNYLFGFYESEAAELICVIPAEVGSYFCNRAPSPTWLDQVFLQTNTQHGSGNFLSTNKEAEELITGYWSLPLMTGFVADYWGIAVSIPSKNMADSLLPGYQFLVLIFGGLVVLPLFLVMREFIQ